MVVSDLRRVGALIVAFGALWYLLLAQLSQFWAVVPEYSFGWLVPLLCGYLFLLDWRSRPEPNPSKSRAAKWIIYIAGFALLPTWLIAPANPDWRLICWLLSFETIAICLGGVYLAGGKPWLKHFAFSICLILAAVPWPDVFERAIVQGLTGLSTTLTVAALNLLQIHAIQQGNIVQLNTGAVGIDEACSGIQSLQAAIMLSLFLGELYRGSLLRRILLVLCGGLIAFGCNLGRTLSLSAIGAQQGTDSIPAWHDPLGYAVLTVCFLSVWGVARIILGPLPAREATAPKTPSAYPQGMIIGLGAWILFIFVGTEVWYRAHERTDAIRWSFKWPVGKQTFAEIPITNLEARMLLFDEGRGGEWTNEDSSHWVAYFFRWAKGPSWSRIRVRQHRPEVCFPAAGWTPCGDQGMIMVQAKGVSIPFHALVFADSGLKEYVFYCVWEEGPMNSGTPLEDEWSRTTRLRSVLLGQRNLGQQSLEIVISDVESQKEAEAIFKREVGAMIDAGTSDLLAYASHQRP